MVQEKYCKIKNKIIKKIKINNKKKSSYKFNLIFFKFLFKLKTIKKILKLFTLFKITDSRIKQFYIFNIKKSKENE
jgi:hypothetical protein